MNKNCLPPPHENSFLKSRYPLKEILYPPLKTDKTNKEDKDKDKMKRSDKDKSDKSDKDKEDKKDKRSTHLTRYSSAFSMSTSPGLNHLPGVQYSTVQNWPKKSTTDLKSLQPT